MRKYISLFLIITSLLSYSQEFNKKLFKKKFLDAEYFFLFEDYKKALPLYLELYKMDSTNANVAYRIGICYNEDKIHFHKAIPFLEKATQNISPHYRVGSYKERGAHYDVWKYLGRAYQRDFEFDKAIRAYEKYMTYLDVDNLKEIEITKKDIESCNNAKDLLVQSALNFVKADIMDENINTPYPEYNPCVNDSENIMIFTSRRRYKLDKNNEIKLDDIDEVPDEFYMEDIYMSKKVNDEWTKAKRITKIIKADVYTSAVSLSHDGKKLFLMRKDILTANEDEGNIYMSEYKNNHWTPMKKLNKNINTSKWETFASISNDGTRLYFTSDRPGGYGGLDIYVSYIDENGEWGPAVNLGPEINTPLDEESPVILADGKTLYFSSQGHYNIGGFDIFYSKMTEDGDWSQPINLGYPSNTMDDDMFYAPIKDGKEAYFALETAEGFGNTDIFKLFISKSTFGDFGVQEFLSSKTDTLTFPCNLADLYRINERIDNSSIKEQIKYVQPSNEEVPVETALKAKKLTIKGRIILADNNQIDSSFSIKVIDPNVVQTSSVLKPDIETGKYVFNTIINSIILEATGNGYKKAVKKIEIPDDYNRKEMVVDITMYPNQVASGEYYKIKSIFFDYGKYDLSREAKIQLEKLYEIMKKNPSLYVEVIGHTDSKSSAAFNKKLSEKRARAAIEYLAKKGITPNRFVAKAMGEDNPIAINENEDGSDNPEGRKLNRRVDIKLLNTDIANIIVEPVYVPENLKYKSHKKHIKQKNYVVVAVTNKALSDYKGLKMKEIKAGNKFVYTLGNFDDKSSALKNLNLAIDAGFDDAKIVEEEDFNKLINKTKTPAKPKENIVYNNPNPVYSIQLKALSRPVDIKSVFKDLAKNIKEYLGKDGFYRYTYKEYSKKEDAKAEIPKILEKGYSDAFVIDVRKYKERDLSGDAEYTIQLKALKKPISLKFFKNIKGVKEYIGNDGLYKYTYGKYNNIEDARKALKKIKKKGYTDAFIVNTESYYK